MNHISDWIDVFRNSDNSVALSFYDDTPVIVVDTKRQGTTAKTTYLFQEWHTSGIEENPNRKR